MHLSGAPAFAAVLGLYRSASALVAKSGRGKKSTSMAAWVQGYTGTARVRAEDSASIASGVPTMAAGSGEEAQQTRCPPAEKPRAATRP